MPPIITDNRPWRRLTDGDMHVVADQPQLRLYPQDRTQLIESVTRAKDTPDGGIAEARAIGSHWAMSEAGVTPGFMIEMAAPVHEPDANPPKPRLNKHIKEVLCGCLTDQALRFFATQNVPTFDPSITPTHDEIMLAHVKGGMRIYELYRDLDGGDPTWQNPFAAYLSGATQTINPTTPGAPLNPDYSGPWALPTMGGAGGQTIAGVVSTATHGGDQHFGAISDAVVAVHLIDAQGQEHWIERTRLGPTKLPLKLVDEEKLQAVYPHILYKADDDFLNAVIVSAGRMGVIYSLVLSVVRQFALEEKTVQSDWSDVKQWITDKTNPFFTANRFCRIDVNCYGGFWHPSERTCYVISRMMRELDAAGTPPYGRVERGAADTAGVNVALVDSGDGWFHKPCDSDDWIHTGLDDVEDIFQTALEDATVAYLTLDAAITAAELLPVVPGVPALIPSMLAAQAVAASAMSAATDMILSIESVEAILPNAGTFDQSLALAANFCAHSMPLIDLETYGMLYSVGSSGEHHPLDKTLTGISYAIMDEHDYQNVGCVSPADSIEIFMDADSPKLVEFIDLMLARVMQLWNGELSDDQEAFGGYISLRFQTESPATLAMQRWGRTVSIEIAGLSHVDGTDILMAQIERDTHAFDAILHWGQRNHWGWKDVEQHFSPAPGGRLWAWRNALSHYSEHGRYATFSTKFTKQKGLEITDPIIGGFEVKPTHGCADEAAIVTVNAISNPPETNAFLDQIPLNGGPTKRIELNTLEGTRPVVLGAGLFTWRLVLERELEGRTFTDTRDLEVQGFAEGDVWKFILVAEQRQVDGVSRWAAERNLFSAFISDKLQAIGATLTRPSAAPWVMRNAEAGDVHFANGVADVSTPSRPKFNTNWLFFSEAAATGAPPTIEVSFKLGCLHA